MRQIYFILHFFQSFLTTTFNFRPIKHTGKMISAILLAGILFCCDDAKDIDREEECMNVYIPLTIHKSSVLQMLPIVYNDVNFLEMSGLVFSRDTLFKLGAYCGGMVLPKEDVETEFSLALDSLSSLQNKQVPQSVYRLLPEEYYSMNNRNVTIPEGKTNGYLEINLKLSQIPEGGQFILPLRISATSSYPLDPERSFILLGIHKP